jgi:hypothetical protein
MKDLNKLKQAIQERRDRTERMREKLKDSWEERLQGEFYRGLISGFNDVLAELDEVLQNELSLPVGKEPSLRKTFPIEAFGCKIEIIGGTVSPKEEAWNPLCPHCAKPLFVKLFFDNEACEWSMLIERVTVDGDKP